MAPRNALGLPVGVAFFFILIRTVYVHAVYLFSL